MSGTKVILIRGTDTGAPTLSGSLGSMTILLDACLVNGFNTKTVTSITRVGQIATVSFATAHGYAADGLSWITLSGSDQTEYNGEFQISNVSTLSFTITVINTPATPGTGTMSCKQTPVGWTKAFTGTNKGAYRSADNASTKLYLRVDDNNAGTDTNKTAMMRGYETMSDIDTGAGLFPSVSQFATGLFLCKSNASDTTPRSWVLVGDGFEFLFFHTPSNNTPGQNIAFKCFHFGDFASEMASDPYGCLIYGDYALNYTTPETSSTSHSFAASINAVQTGHFVARPYSQVGISTNVGKISDGNIGATVFGNGGMPYPAPHNNGLYELPIFINDPSSILRGTLKCIYNPAHTRPLGYGVTVSNFSNLSGRTIYSIPTAYTTYPNCGETHVDITGPWR